MRVSGRLIILAIILSIAARVATAQTTSKPGSAARKSPRVSLVVTAGYVSPLSKDGLTQFWKGGPGCALSLLVRAAPRFWVGTGVDVSALWFRVSRFQQAYPSVQAQGKNMAWFNIFMLSRFGFIPGGSVHPYVELAVGASRLSGAEYKAVVDSVRVTYYEIPARTRLAVTFTGGLEIPLSGSLSFLAEGAFRYVHNDENLGIGLLASAGVRVIL